MDSVGATTLEPEDGLVAPGFLTRGWSARSGCGAILARGNHLLSRSCPSLALLASSVYARRRSFGSLSLASYPRFASLTTKTSHEALITKPGQAATHQNSPTHAR